MRLSASEKTEITRIVKGSALGVNKTLKRLSIHKRTFYIWYLRWSEDGKKGLESQRQTSRQWNSIPQDLKNLAVECALDALEISPRELALSITDDNRVFISESIVYRILKAAELIESTEHRFIANIINLHNYFHPKQLPDAIAAWLEYYNNPRYHESLGNLTPANVYFGWGDVILETPQKIKLKTLKIRIQN